MEEEKPTFSFPGEPYGVQTQFMRELYYTLTYCKGGIFQSPTGTGKSLSIICGAFQWLKDTLTESHLPVSPEMPLESNHELDSASESSELEYDNPSSGPPKIIYCSRTHSQVKQFVSEIKRTTFQRLKVIPLASRSRMCVNQAAKLSDDIGKYCKAATKSEDPLERCPYYNEFSRVSDQVLSQVMDIEEIVLCGQRCGGCPYYGVMKSVEFANVILAPYQYLLCSHILKTMHIVDKNTVIIFDEAHNVIDTILESNSYEKSVQKFERAEVSITEMLRALTDSAMEGLATIKDQEKYGPAVLQEELERVRPDLTLAKDYINYALNTMKGSRLANLDSVSFPPLYFLAQCHIPVSLLQTLSERLSNYAWAIWRRPVSILKNGKPIEMPSKDVKRIVSVIRFLSSFTIDPDAHVIILKSLNRKVNLIKLLLVDPLKIFTSLLNGAKCIVLAGGTMDPMGEYKQLFESILPDELHICDCAHVIPPESMQLSVISKGMNNEDLTLTYEKKNSPETLAAIGKVLERLCELIPNGIVCFFSSFDHVAKFLAVIRDNGTLQRIDALKQVFEDKRNSAIFNPYEEAARHEGAILFTVIRGSLSEGINFKHEVGRCAVIIGQPYPNAHEPEMKCKMSFWDSAGGEMKGKDYLQNLCYKAVNQCMGRVIRDSKDYAVVVLIDSRYLRPESMEKLSSWTKRNWARTGTLNCTFEAIRRFFEGRMNVS